jgi:hypothetical protein
MYLFEGGECNSSPFYTAADRRRKTITNRKSIKNGYGYYVAMLYMPLLLSLWRCYQMRVARAVEDMCDFCDFWIPISYL